MISGSLAKVAAIALVLSLASCSEVVTRNAIAVPAERTSDDTLIVLTDTDPEGLIADAVARGYVLISRTDMSELRDSLLSFRIPYGTSIPEAIEEVEALQPGSTAGANHAYRLQADVTTRSVANYADDLIGWPTGSCRISGRVGIIDAGVTPTHPGFETSQIIQQNFSQSGTLPQTDHGTLMADIMLADQRLGDVQLFSANVIDSTIGDGQMAGAEAIVRALEWMMRNDVPVVNISLAGPHNKILRRGLVSATERGLIVVAATGNLGPYSAPLFPAGYPFTIGATAIDSGMQVYARAVQGEQVDIAAPGVDVLVESEGQLRVVNGTSAAATFVSSAIVADPSLSTAVGVDTVRATLNARATDLGTEGRDTVFGAGLLRAAGSCG